MGNLLKSTVLLGFAIMLSFAGVNGKEWNSSTRAALDSRVTEKAQSNVSQRKQIKYQLINRNSEIVVSPVNNSSAPNPKNPRLEFQIVSYSIEHRIQCLIAKYLSQSKDICCSLASNDIIYPFHYFW